MFLQYHRQAITHSDPSSCLLDLWFAERLPGICSEWRWWNLEVPVSCSLKFCSVKVQFPIILTSTLMWKSRHQYFTLVLCHSAYLQAMLVDLLSGFFPPLGRVSLLHSWSNTAICADDSRLTLSTFRDLFIPAVLVLSLNISNKNILPLAPAPLWWCRTTMMFAHGNCFFKMLLFLRMLPVISTVAKICCSSSYSALFLDCITCEESSFIIDSQLSETIISVMYLLLCVFRCKNVN